MFTVTVNSQAGQTLYCHGNRQPSESWNDLRDGRVFAERRDGASTDVAGLTDGCGNIVELYAYTPYGAQTILVYCFNRNRNFGKAAINCALNLYRRSEMSKMTRRHFNSEQKVALLRLHLVEGKAISEICAENELQVNMFYRWQKEFFENGAAAFEARKAPTTDGRDRRIRELEEKLADRDEGIAELMMEHVRVKKKLGLL